MGHLPIVPARDTPACIDPIWAPNSAHPQIAADCPTHTAPEPQNCLDPAQPLDEQTEVLRCALSCFACCCSGHPPCWPPPTTADFFALITAKDFAGVEAALTNADSTGEALAQRGLFDFFRNSHPAITEFTAAWLAAEPDNPYALTARGWQQLGWGWALRGEDFPRNIRREAIQKMRALHNEALDLFTQASSAAPDLLAASDGLLVLTKTLGNIEIIPVELERIMARHPNRHSLMTAMMALAPQWGGRMEQVGLLCARYASLITTIADYSADICRVDAVYTASFANGPARDAAHTALQTMTHPVLDDARRVDALNSEEPAPAHSGKADAQRST